MRNLKLQYCNRIDSKIENIKHVLTDPNGGKRNPDSKLYLVTENQVFATNEKLQNIKELAIKDNIVGAEYLVLSNEICIATSDGRVLSIDPETGIVNENSYCEVGLLSMTWSPEQEVVVFITKSLNVVVMTCTYDPISEHVLEDECDQTQQFINVGWGRKETQFHGSEGKSAAKQPNTYKKPKDIEEDDINDIRTTWRFDGAYFVVSFVSTQYGRMFKVFDKEGILQYISEKMNGLQAPISWRPSGTWIALPHSLPNKSTIALFEKNGLRHREIVLPFNFVNEKIVNLNWSTESDILAIQTESIGEEKQQIYLYTIGNYHWYLKQTLSFKVGEKVVSFQFENDDALERTLNVMLNTGQYLNYSWFFGVDKFDKDGIVAVIDGKKLLLTNFSKAIVPPPMSSNQIEIDSNINNCSFLEDNVQNVLHLYLYDTQRRLHHYKTEINESKEFESIGVFKPAESLDDKTYSNITNFTFCSTECFIAVSSNYYTTNYFSFALDRCNSVYAFESSLQTDGIVNALDFDGKSKKLFAHTVNGCVRILELDSHIISLGKQHVRIPHTATQLLAFSFDNDIGIIGLCDNQSLYIDNQHIADYVTSICLEGSYLAYTKHSSLSLLNLSTRKIADQRQIESGGRLIVICSRNSRTVLQMPRGNLETIYPRLLLLDRVGKWLDFHEYALVMDLLVKQRINLNIICDHNLIDFVENVRRFVESIKNVHWLNLFLSDLKNEDITKTMYVNSYTNSPRVYPSDFKIEQKVQYICEHMLAYMENAEDAQQLTLPMITAKVKMGNLEAALDLIWNLKKQENNTRKVQSEEALKYLLYLVDVNELYNVALGTYDFGLVLFVAQKSQRDPREFLPFLNALKDLDLDYRKFKIDEHLKRYSKALGHISKCNESNRFEEAIEFIVHHQLYSEALDCYKTVSSSYKRVCLAYADFLRAAGKFDNASLLYERGGDINQALRCAKHVLDWQRVLHLAHKEKPDTVKDVALSIVPALLTKRMHLEAFFLLNTYGNDFLEGLNCLLKGNLHLKAISEVRLHEQASGKCEGLTTDEVLPHLSGYVELLKMNLNDSENTFIKYKTRLLDLRVQREKQRDNLALNGFENEQGFDESDLLSDTTSMRSSHYTGSSRGTGKTFRSSKNRRKHERKHFSLKPDNPFEDIALIDVLYSHAMKVFEQQMHIRDTCKALLELQQDKVAAELQRQYKKLLTLIQSSLDEIWIVDLNVGAQKLTFETNMNFKRYQNEQRYTLLDPIKRHKPQMKIVDWEHAMLT